MSKQANNSYSGSRKALFYFLVILIPLTIFFILAELMTRLLSPPQMLPAPPPITTIDPYQPNPYVIKLYPYIYSYIPGSKFIQARSSYQVKYEINSQGFRGPEIPYKKPEGLKRLLVVGDSVVEGHGIEFTQTFSYLLGENFQSFGWEVINGGIGGASPIYYAANMERYLLLKPDVVLIVIYDNDIIGDRIREVEYFECPFFDDTDKLLKRSTMVDILSASRFFNVVRREWQRRIINTPIEQIADQNRANWSTYQQQWALFKESPNLVPTSFIDQQWSISQPYLDYVLTLFHEHNIQVFVANLSVRPPNSPYYTHIRHLDERVSAWTKEKELPFLSLLSVIAQVYEEKQPSEIIIIDDSHPTPETHALIETALRSWLLQYLDVE